MLLKLLLIPALVFVMAAASAQDYPIWPSRIITSGVDDDLLTRMSEI